MDDIIDRIAEDPNLTKAEKVEKIEDYVAALRSRAADPVLPLESQHAHLLVSAEEALLRLKSGS
ncbi:MAG: hypothetical protein AAF415_16990 [Pseudomonadota bacterium]